jgi:hypothetical protein
MSFVALDIGASNTRFTSDNGRIDVLPNNMVMLGKETKVDLEVTDDSIENIKNALEVQIEKDGESEFFPMHVLIGSMASRYASTNKRPSVNGSKYSQPVNYASAITAIAVNKLMFNLAEDIDLYIALPPIEVKTAKEIVKNNFVGKYKVVFPKLNGGTTINFNITNVVCYEESFMAMLSYFFDMNGKMKESAKKYATGCLLSLDIGASTTDIAIVQGGKYLEMSGQTYRTGGNVARDADWSMKSGATPANALIAFASNESGAYAIYTMHPVVGSTATNITPDFGSARMPC